ncbi:stalk domain-containing protein [Paenibacillus sp. 1P07SE]|uniref:stalk domain-containing protein n=1 Tax=Paenibacillus sp. 1P07SE TaxID=3132209 RepID=UPI0039A62E63
MMRPKPVKKRSKKTPMIALAAAIALSVPAVAAPIPQASAQHLVQTQTYAIDGTRVDLPTINIDGTTYIGLRSLNTSLGLNTNYSPINREVHVEGNNRTMTIDLSEPVSAYFFNDQRVYGMSAIVQDGTTYMPVRFLLERMGYGISYDAAAKTVGITQIQENDLTIETHKIESGEGEPHVLVHYPQVSGYADEEAQASVNAFLKEQAEQRAAAGAEEIARAQSENDAAEADNPDLTIPPVSFDGTYLVTYNEQDKLSLYVDYYSYTGGAHGITDRAAYTFDLTTGEQLSLQDAANGRADYVEVINDSIQRQLDAGAYHFMEPFESIDTADQNFFLKHDAIVVYFGVYEYTAYAEGIPEFPVPFTAFE